MTIVERLNNFMLASFHYRNRELLMKWVTSEHNRKKFKQSARELEAQKNAILTAIRNGEYIN